MTVEDRFWEKVDIGEDGECWPWLAYRHPNDYGQFWLDGKQRYAHRAAWILAYGEIPEGMCVCHHCDCPPCCNPAHLFLGTKADNTADMKAKGRGRGPHLKGERHGRAKLTEADVLEIRMLWAETDLHQGEIGEMFGVADNTVGNIVLGKTWTHI